MTGDPMPTRVLHLVYSGGLYGIERMLLALLPALRSRGFEPTLGCFGDPTAPNGAIGRAASEAGIRTVFLGDAHQGGFRGARDLHRALRELAPDLVHLHGYKATIIGGVLARIHRIPAVATYHAEARQAVGLRLQVAAESPVLRLLARVVAVSQPIAAELAERGVRTGRIVVIPNGIAPTSPPRVEPRGTFPVAVVGRLVAEKNVQMVLESVAALRGRFPALRVLIAGEGPYRASLEARVAALGLREVVTFAGFVTDVPSLLAGAAAFAMPSQTEGMPISLLEAMAAGVPIIASAVGSIPEIVRDGREALLIPRNDQGALTAALERLLTDPASARVRSEAASARFRERFTAEAMADAYGSLYRAAVDRPVR